MSSKIGQMFQRILQAFRIAFAADPSFVVRAPGRVNLIGEHTDYNAGLVLPMALDRAVWIALRPRPDRRVQVHSLDFDQFAEFRLDGFSCGESGWIEYIKGVANEMQREGFKLEGWEGVMAGDVPRGAGLSSSAAVEMSAARAFTSVGGWEWDSLRMAGIGQRAESNWVGVKCGIMDQAVSAAAKAGNVFFLDCRTLEFKHIPLPAELAVVVMDTSTRRGLVTSTYNERRSQCEQAARFFGVRALRDVTMEQFNNKSEGLNEIVMRRARHVVTENARVARAVDAMQAGDASVLGMLLNESHASLRDDFEVTNSALNLIVEIAQSQPACFGARMTGAGFGGCAVALVPRARADKFIGAVGAAYRSSYGKETEIFVCEAGEGASVIK